MSHSNLEFLIVTTMRSAKRVRAEEPESLAPHPIRRKVITLRFVFYDNAFYPRVDASGIDIDEADRIAVCMRRAVQDKGGPRAVYNSRFVVPPLRSAVPPETLTDRNTNHDERNQPQSSPTPTVIADEATQDEQESQAMTQPEPPF